MEHGIVARVDAWSALFDWEGGVAYLDLCPDATCSSDTVPLHLTSFPDPIYPDMWYLVKSTLPKKKSRHRFMSWLPLDRENRILYVRATEPESVRHKKERLTA